MKLIPKALFLIIGFSCLSMAAYAQFECVATTPVITVTDNICDPETDGSYEITTPCEEGFTIEFSTDGGATFTTTLPTYPTPFITRCVGEICVPLDISGLNESNDAFEEVNMGNVMIGLAVLTINQTFNGTSTLDENEITNSQTTGDVGISSGVSHDCIQNVCGLIDNSMNNQYNFSMPVCNLTIDLWDLDRDDEMLLQAFDAMGNPVTYTINTIGMGVNNMGNSFYSNNPNVNYPSDGPATLGMFSVTFDGCISQIEIDYFDRSDTAGDGGSYTIVFFQENCVFEECISDEVPVMANPMDCSVMVCPEDIEAILEPSEPECLGTVVTFDASSSTGQGVNYEWDFDSDGIIDLTSTDPLVGFTYPTAGTFTVTLTVFDPLGICEPDITSIEIIICEAVTVICPLGPATVVDGDPIDPATLGEPLFTTTACSPEPTFTFVDVVTPGMCPNEEVITRTFTITDNCGITQCVQDINVLVDNPATINALPITSEICLGDAILLDASASVGDGLSYCWNVGIGTVGCDFTTPTATQIYTAPGVYFITLEITDQFGCMDVQTIGAVTVYQGPELIANIDFDPCTLTLDFDASMSIDNAPPSNLIFTWDFGDGNTSGMPSGTHIFENCAVANTITVTIVDPNIPFPACNSDQLIFNVETDTEPPVLICPPVSELMCGDPIPTFTNVADFIAAGGQATDNCDIINFDVISIDTVAGICPFIFQVSVGYQASDICGNISSCTQIFNLTPELPAASFPPNVVLSCGDDISQATLGSPVIQTGPCLLPADFTVEEVMISGSCPGDVTIERTFIITDICGNTIEETQIITIINDINPTLVAPPDITIECTEACDPDVTGGIAVAVDFCMPIDGTTNEVTITFEDEIIGFNGEVFSGGIAGFIIRTFTGVDACGNTTTVSQTISIRRGDNEVLVCNDQINVSLNSDCDGITPDFLLEAPNEDSKFFLTVGNPHSTGDVQIGFADSAQSDFEDIDFSVFIEAGEPVPFTISDFCGNSCWGQILVESNVIPRFESPCTHIPGNFIDESDTIGEEEDDSDLNTLFGLTEDPARATDLIGQVTLSDGSCQDAFVLGISDFKFIASHSGGPLDIQSVDLELILVNIETGQILSYTFPRGVINVTSLDMLIANPGTYDVYVAASDPRGFGDYSIHVEVGTCLPTCTTVCEGGFPDEFVTKEEMQAMLDEGCSANLVGDLFVETTESGEMCEGILHVQTCFGTFNLHGELVKRELLTQAFIELPIDLSETDIMPPNTVVLECGDDVTPESILALTGSGSQAYPFFFDFNQVVVDTICLEEVVDHFTVAVDTVQEMVFQNGVWLLLDIVKKEQRDSVRCLRRGPNPDIRFQEIFIDENLCNVLVDFSDIVIETCGSGRKIIRDWTIVDWCRSSAQILFSQNIEVVDDVAPTIEKTDDLVLSIDPWSCTATYRLPTLTHEDNCESSILTEVWRVSHGRVIEGFIIDLTLSDDPISAFLAVSDECGNTALDTVNLFIQDLVPPVAICKDGLTVALTSAMLNDNNGGGRVFAESFDAGSNDSGCSETEISVRRVNGCCAEQCMPVYQCVSFDVKTGTCIDSTITSFTSDFSDSVKFCCDDVGQIVQVELMIVDKAGNHNSCILDVNVTDNTQATLVCEPVTVNCDDDISVLGPPTITGVNCNNAERNLQMLQESELSGVCGTDQVIREWFIDRDGSGGLSSGDPFCQQLITIDQSNSGLDPTTIKWPRHFTGEVFIGQNIECDNDNDVIINSGVQVNMGDAQICDVSVSDFTTPVWCESVCGLIASSVEQDTIFSSDACFKLINRWTVIDWCTWDPNGNNIDDENDSSSDSFIAVEDWAQGVCAGCPEFGPVISNPVYFSYESVDVDGFYTFDQIIRVIDDSAPTIDVVNDFVVQTTGGATSKDDATSCRGDDVLTATATDLCNGTANDSQLLRWQVTVLRNGQVIDIKIEDGPTVSMNTGSGSPGDIHEIIWTAVDGCGNESTATTEVTFGDRTSPVPFCISGLSTTIPNNSNEVVVWAADLDFGSFDNCTDADELTFALVREGVAPLTPSQEGFESQQNFVLNCDDAGSRVFIDLWVFDQNENADFCTTSIELSSGCNDSVDEGSVEEGSIEEGSSNQFIAGSIANENGEPIMNSFVSLHSSQPEYPKSTMVTEQGEFIFLNNTTNFNYQLDVLNDLDHANGVSTFDILLMQRHIIGLAELDSPYKIIAADANYDGGVSVADAVEMRKIVLGKVLEFEFNTSWRFVNKDAPFIDESNPWPFIEDRIISNLQSDMVDQDFIGVKIGDVNDSAVPNNFANTEIRNAPATTIIASLDKDDPRQLALRLSKDEKVNAIQFFLNTENNQIQSIRSETMTISDENYIIDQAEFGFSWNTDDNFASTLELIITFENELTQGDLSRFTLNDNRIQSEVALSQSSQLYKLNLEIEQHLDDVASLMQNVPNPFSKQTSIQFYLPNGSESLSLRIYDLTGKELFRVTESYKAGMHNVVVPATQLGSSGTYYYQINSKELQDSKTMILIK